MSDLELEKAAMAPRRWIELCGALEKRCLNDPGAILILRPRETRCIYKVPYSASNFFIVPGGRYLVGSLPDRVFILDLGYTSSSACKLIASVEPKGGSVTCIVRASPDGMGLIILSANA